MCCEQLVCASCAAPVREGRCPTCRGARAELHHSAMPGGAAWLWFAALLTVLWVLAVQLG